MERKPDKISQILTHLAGAASAAADGVSDAVHAGKQAVGEKYDEVKLSIELSRLQEEQQKYFRDIGRTMHLIQSGVFAAEDDATQGELVDAQQTIDRLLLLADQKQQEIDQIAQRLSELNGSKMCVVCGKVASSKDSYCAACGTKLSDEGN